MFGIMCRAKVSRCLARRNIKQQQDYTIKKQKLSAFVITKWAETMLARRKTSKEVKLPLILCAITVYVWFLTHPFSLIEKVCPRDNEMGSEVSGSTEGSKREGRGCSNTWSHTVTAAAGGSQGLSAENDGTHCSKLPRAGVWFSGGNASGYLL